MWGTDSLIVLGLSAVGLGTINEADGPLEHCFRLRNVGTDSVVLVQGYTSCGCTTISYARGAMVAPGDSTSVCLQLNPRGKGGEFLETGTLVYGPHRKRLQLSLTGICQTSEETLLRQFPIRVGDHLRLSANHFDLGILRVGEQRERSVVVLHLGDSAHQERIPISVTVSKDTPKGLQHIQRTITVGDESVTITFDAIVK